MRGRRNDTADVGNAGELEVKALLEAHGWTVENLNEIKRNNPTYDLRAMSGEVALDISVKVARSRNRHLRLGSIASLQRLSEDSFIIALLPAERGKEIHIETKNYEVWIVPGTAKHEAIAVHTHYHCQYPFSRTAMTTGPILKDKVDRANGRSISGATFKKWRELYRDAWHLLDSQRR